MTERTAKEWWELLNSAPNIAGPWQGYWTEEQRVREMRVRRLSRLGYREIIALVYGPLMPMFDYSGDETKRTMWAVHFMKGYDTNGWRIHNGTGIYDSLPGQFESMEAAMAAADARLVKEGWLLLDNEEANERAATRTSIASG